MASQNADLKAVLLECIESSLHADDNVRRGAEERLKALEVTEAYGTYLLDIVLDAGKPSPIRLLASVLLRQYVNTHWSSLADKFVEPEVTGPVKQVIRQMAPMGLLEQQSKIRKSVASVVSSIAHWDWPEQWPGLFDTLMAYLRDPKGIEGAMSVMTDFVKELTDVHIREATVIIFPEMLRIIQDSNTYPSHIRAKAVNVFRTCSRMLVTVSEMDKHIISTNLDPVLPAYIETFTVALTEPQSMDVGYALKKEIVKTIAAFIRNNPKKFSSYLPNLLSPIWGILTSSIEAYREILNGNEDEDDADEEGENNGIGAVLYAIFDLVQNLISSKNKSLIKNYLADLIFYTVYYMQLPQEKVEEWISHPGSFANDEDEEAATYTLRVCAQDLLTVTYDCFKADAVVALGQAVNRHLSVAGADWRIQEACLFAVCTLGTSIADSSEGSKEGCFDIQGFVQNVVIPGLSSADILLVGRCIVLGSNFSRVISPPLSQDFVRATAECLQPDRTVILKILAVKALSIYLRLREDNEVINKAILDVLPGAVDSLIHFATTEGNTSVLSLVLDCLILILTVNESLTAAIGQKITTLCIACFVKYNADPVVAPLIEEIVSALAKNQQCLSILQDRFTPTLASVLSNVGSEEMVGTHGVALDLLTVIIRASPIPLNDALINVAFPSVLRCVSQTDDHTVLQNGGECLRAFVALAPEQVIKYRDNTGNSGLMYVVEIACRLLDPTSSEFTAALAGKLVTTLITKTGDVLGEQLELLLRAVLSKLQSAETLSVIQNLCMVYAHLLNTQMTATLNFLESFPGPTGKSALHFVMTEWLSRQHMFFGYFDRKVCAIALSKLLLLGVNDSRLADIIVKGDEVFDPKEAGRVQTRSRKVAAQWTSISAPIKMFKLLVNELAYFSNKDDFDVIHHGENGDGDSFGFHDDLSDKDDDTDDGDESEYAMSGNDLPFFNMDGGDEFNDIASDPIYNVQIEEYLQEFLSTLSQQAYYPQFTAHLTQQEKKALTAKGIPS